MKKTYEYVGTIDLREIIYITDNNYIWNSGYSRHNQSFEIYFKSGAKREISWNFSGVKNNPDTEDLINFRKMYAELVNDYLNLNL